MSQSPVIEADLGDGETRRLFFGASEIKLFEAELGAGWRSFYLAMAGGTAKHDHIKRALRLALIGGGADPALAGEVVDYCATPPRPLKPVYIAVSECLEAIWNGYPEAKSRKASGNATDAELDDILEIMRANFIRAGHDVDLTGMSMPQVAALHDRVFGAGDKPAAPDDETFMAIKKASQKGKK